MGDGIIYLLGNGFRKGIRKGIRRRGE